MQHTAAVLAVGDELTLGQSLDTNSRHLSARLLDLGLTPIEHATVPDDLDQLVGAMRRLAGIADVVLITGGLGPTADDLTRRALAEATGDELIEDAEARAHIEGWYAGRAAKMPESNLVQALRPRRGRCLPNPHGTAPGLSASLGVGGRTVAIFALPGPPREMRPMLETHVLPALQPDASRTVRTRLLRVFGLGESDVAQRLGELMSRDRNPLVGTTASLGVVTVRMRYDGAGDGQAAERALDASEGAVREILGRHSIGPLDLPEAVLGALGERGETLAVAESCTGGMLAASITDLAGASRVFAGGFFTYSNAAKHAHLGVAESLFPERGGSDAPGAVSAECALAMARGCLERGVLEWAGDRQRPTHTLSVTGIAGPDGGSSAKPVGTVWIARASSDGSAIARRFVLKGDRGTVRAWSVRAALSCLWAKLADADDLTLLREEERREA
ncbi:MAG: CinA family nicotinamide mononucleotide deamidase-related protein [Phycisphaerales bacterium]|nr:MAG: CinA family nicotinamide mononucleotide deamidase-related protein [Phycisphaerales bacterium]